MRVRFGREKFFDFTSSKYLDPLTITVALAAIEEVAWGSARHTQIAQGMKRAKQKRKKIMILSKNTKRIIYDDLGNCDEWQWLCSSI